MARRMFSDEITKSDAFLDMPSGSQILYFHLGMEADDDGFISSPKMIKKLLGSTDDEYKILIAKKFIIIFENGICVVKHWRINNQIRKDRYTETKYVKEKKSLFIRKNGSYTTNPENAMPVPEGHFSLDDMSGNQLATSGVQTVALGKYSIGELSIDKVSKENTNTFFLKNTNSDTLYKDLSFVSRGEGSKWLSKNLFTFPLEDHPYLKIVELK